jgi:hypothetical protein
MYNIEYSTIVSAWSIIIVITLEKCAPFEELNLSSIELVQIEHQVAESI